MHQITDILGQIRGGRFVAVASDALQEVVREVVARQGSGSVTIELKIAPDKAEGETGVVEIRATVKTKLPAQKEIKSIFFAAEDGDLRREDPRQRTLELAGERTGTDG